MKKIVTCLCWVPLLGCIPAPPPITVASGVDSLSDTDFEPTAPWESAMTPDGTDVTGVDTDSGSDAGEGTASETGSPATSSSDSASGTASTSSTTSDATGTTGEEGETTGGTGNLPSFGPPGVFGDDVRETDLVGVWTTPWDPVGVPDVSITIAADGSFDWRETSADCSTVRTAAGRLWVEGTQLVIEADAWDKRDPWQVEERLGAPLARPFRMRLGYGPMGGYLGIAGADGLLQQVAWQGRTYDRQAAGVGADGSWVAEGELWALIEDEPEPRLVVRDRFSAELGPAGAATLTTQRSWWYPGEKPDTEAPAVINTTWFDETPGAAVGAANVGGTRHAYDAVHMISFTADQSFQLGVVSDCAP